MSQIELDAQQDTPFLGFDEGQDEPLPHSPSVLRRTSTWQIASPKRIIILLGLLKFSIVCTGLMIMTPMYRLIEDALCHAHFNNDSEDLMDEMECKVDEVQQSLAVLLGWLGLVNSLINLIVAYPYGLLADTIGRKPTLMLSYGGVAISFLLSPFMLGTLSYAVRKSPFILILGSFMQLIGGGVPVMMSTLYSIASDVSTDENKASNFIYLSIGATVGGTLGPLASGLLMSKFGPWIPIYIVACTVPLVFSIFALLPETLAVKAGTGQVAYQPPVASFKNRISQGILDLRRSLHMMKNINIPLILVCFFFHNARFTAYTSTLAQYISKHFGWTLAETSVLLSPLSVVNLLMLASLPKVSEWLMVRYKLSTFGKDIWLTRASYVILAFASWTEGLSRSIGPFLFGLFINTLGAAEAPLARASVSHFVEPGYTSRMYALLGMAEVLGSFTGAPVLAWCFSKGLELKGFWTGLPWYYLGMLASITLAALMFVRPPKKDWNSGGSGSRWRGDDDEAAGFPPNNPVRLE